MSKLRAARLALPSLLFAAMTFVACDSGPDPAPQPSSAADDPTGDAADVEDAVSSLDGEIGPANSCRVPPQTCSSSHKCCSGSVCLNDDLTPDPAPSLRCRACGKADELCCGARRAHSLKELEKRCHQRGFVCPQSESSDICEPCGEEFQHCCLEKGGKTSCKNGLECQGVGKGGKNREAFPGTCR